MILLKKYFLIAIKKGWIRKEGEKYYLMPGGPREIKIYEDEIQTALPRDMERPES